MWGVPMARHRNLDAAVLQDGEPGSEDVARVVPKGAQIVKGGHAVLGYWNDPTRLARRRFNLRTRRAAEIELLARLRYRAGPPSSDDARALATAVASVAEPDAAANWIGRWCVKLNADEQHDIIVDAAENPRRWSAAEFGLLLNLTEGERAQLGIRTFRAAGVTRRMMTAERRRKAAAHMRTKRADTAEAKSKAISQEQAAPWNALGISRATYFRRVRLLRDTDPVSSIGREILLTRSVAPQSHRANERAQPWRAEGISRSQWYRRRATAKHKAASDQARSTQSLKAKPSMGQAEPERSREGRREGAIGRFSPRPGSYAARAAPPFGDVSDFAIPGSLRILPLATAGANHLVSTEAYRPDFIWGSNNGA